ncbi:MAG: type II CRISPR-associated endonuclease Cas1 [Bacteroidetes bacterium]|nr:MAG: type II CRISPR-associated endonuclease Cas1 [Bacteroidota bacterium]
MIKRTLFFENPAYLSTHLEQLVIDFPEKEKEKKTIPIEDIGMVILDNPQITLSQQLMAKLLQNNAAIVACDQKHMPLGLWLNLDGHTLQSARHKEQIESSVPLRKQLWQQTVKAKIENQAAVLRKQGVPEENMRYWSTEVKSGDTENHEGRAAAYYWKTVFKDPEFIRDRSGLSPNNLLNYGYAILRACVARALVGSGLFPAFGIHHRNQYNPYCLADDIMEPFRPYVDLIVLEIIAEHGKPEGLHTSLKKELLQIPSVDVYIDGLRSPLMLAVQRSTASLAKCFEGELRKISYPQIL